VLREASTLTTDSKENIAAAQKNNAEVEALIRQLKTEKDRAAVNPRFNENVNKVEQLLREATARQQKYATTN
jgi:CMP-N-acetylneuraminic acid synthetase